MKASVPLSLILLFPLPSLGVVELSLVAEAQAQRSDRFGTPLGSSLVDRRTQMEFQRRYLNRSGTQEIGTALRERPVPKPTNRGVAQSRLEAERSIARNLGPLHDGHERSEFGTMQASRRPNQR